MHKHTIKLRNHAYDVMHVNMRTNYYKTIKIIFQCTSFNSAKETWPLTENLHLRCHSLVQST